MELNQINSGKKGLVSGVGPHLLHLRFSLCDKAPNLAKDIFVEPQMLEFEVIDDIAQSSHLRDLHAQKTIAVTKISELENIRLIKSLEFNNLVILEFSTISTPIPNICILFI